MNPEVEKQLRDHILRELVAEVKELRRDVSDVVRVHTQAIEYMTRTHVLEARVTRHGRRIRELERVVYEGAPAPELEGPPEHRRPVIPPPAPNEETTGNFPIPPDALATLKSLEEFRQREQRRDSWRWRASRDVWKAVALAVFVAVLGACSAAVERRIERAFSTPTTVSK